ncbi:MAG: 4Fe-4S binding protein [Candidatus Thorarchaeota archaeon]|nr:4Fe-4S binding protein [Candidatus Thorarchaeota archaeon]
MTDLHLEVAGLKFRNPVLTAAGPAARDGMTLLEAMGGGAGGLVAKTVSVKPAEVPNPNMAALDRGRVGARKGLLNAELWSELPLEQWLEKEYPIALSSGLPVIASVGYTPEEVAEVAPKVQKAGVHAIEFSTHYVGGHVEIAKALREAVDIPIFAKLSPKVDVAKVAKSLERYVDGFVAINTFGPCLRIDIETGRPMLGSEGGLGWMSGSALKPIALRCVADIASVVDRPIIGVGGVTTGEDAIEFMMAGASLVEVCTAAILNGPSVYGTIARGIATWLRNHQYDSLWDIVGMAIPHLRHNEQSRPPVQIDMDTCTLCGLCEKSCVYGAIKVDREEKEVRVDSDRCVACGLCTSICPPHAMSLR